MCDSIRATAERLEWLRHYFGKSQKEFAYSLEVLPSSYSNWLNGPHGPSLQGAKALRRVYGVSLDFLYFGDPTGLPEQIRGGWEFRPKQ